MPAVIRTVGVALEGRPYDVLIGPGLLAAAGPRLRSILKRPRLAIVSDATASGLHGEMLKRSLTEADIAWDEIVVPPGEASKSFAELERLCDRLLDLGVERSDLILAFGGGVVGDLAGFAAAILKRGVDFVQVPTTLLAQVDSSVGGKTAIDARQGKNLIGAFHQPRLVLADTEVLRTLPDREMVSGHAEVIKYGLLGDGAFFAWLEVNGAAVLAHDAEALAHAIAHCVAIKARIVAEDEREGGRRALLNLGHTFGHAVESATGFGEAVKHGEAVGLGCAMAFRFSADLGLCPAGDARRVEDALAAAGLPTRLDQVGSGGFRAEGLLCAMAQDKKAQGGALTLVLVRAIGEAFVAKGVDAGALRDFLIAEGARP